MVRHKRTFKIEEVTYVIKDGSRNEKLQTIDGMVKKGIDPLDFLSRFHQQRKMIHSMVEAQLPQSTVTVRLGKGRSYNGDHEYELSIILSDNTGFKHESSHEVQDAKNEKLSLWCNKQDRLSGRFRKSPYSNALNILANLAALEEEGFANYLSEPHVAWNVKNKAKLFKFAMEEGIELGEISIPNFVKIKGITVPNLMGWFKRYKGVRLKALENCHYKLGQRIFETIWMGGYDPKYVGMTKNPVEMLQTYEMACEKLSLTPLITVRDFARIYGRAFGAKF